MFLVPEHNGTIVLPQNYTCAQNGVTYGLATYDEGSVYVWYYPIFSSGNGTTNLHVSAQNCTLSIASLNVYKTSLNGSWYNTTYCLSCEVAGNGTAYLDVMGFNYTDLSVFSDCVVQEQGAVWNLTEFGLVMQGAADLTLFSSSQSYEPPRDPVHDDRPLYVGVTSAVSVALLAVLGVFRIERGRKHRRGSPLKVRGGVLNGRAITLNLLKFSQWRFKSVDKLTELRIGITCMYSSFIALMALGQVLVNDALTVTGLIAFTAAAALTTYYIVETESD